VGGYVVSPFFQGRTAARLAGRILAGEGAGEVPMILESPNRYLFDYEQLQRFEIGRRTLPEQSKIINEPSGFYSRNKGVIITVIFVILTLTAVIVLLMLAIIRKRKAEKVLIEAKQASEAANRTKTEFLANMSHEIRTPLNGILGMLQLLQTTGLSDEQKDYTLAAMQSSNRLTRLLSDILDLSRVEIGKIAFQHEPFSPSQTLCQLVELFGPTAKQSGVELICSVDPNLPGTVLGDEARLHQILNNLVGNAFKFTTEGSITVEATPLPEAKPGYCRILFMVADTGIGIPDEKLDHLFEPFTQASEGFRRPYQGAGLGLSICKRLVTLMGGGIAVESKVGKGTTFYLTASFEIAEGIEPKAEETAVIDSGNAHLKVLLAEDDEVSIVMMKRLLEKAGCRVTVAGNGKQALKSLSGEEFDLVFMDVQMPVMDGVEATRAVRAGEAGEAARDLPIIALTAYAMSGDREKFLEAGMNGYLAKPVDADQLLNLLGKYARG
jgi:signal transduction histidine kinase/ActR/RegA family two-component response regulator